jgi:hypothetical protein
MRFGTYSTEDSFRVVDTVAKAQLQNLLHHKIPHETVIVKVAEKILKRLSCFPNGAS